MRSDSLTSRREDRNGAERPVTTCTHCPVCGSEECLMLEELGTYCSTMTAASLARAEPESAMRR